MGKKNPIKRFLKGARKQAKPMLEEAMQSGASRIGQYLVEAVSETNETNGLDLGRVVDAVRRGMIETGQEIAEIGLQRARSANIPGIPSFNRDFEND